MTIQAKVQRNAELEKLWNETLEMTDQGNSVKVKVGDELQSMTYELALRLNHTIVQDELLKLPFHKALDTEVKLANQLSVDISDRFFKYTGSKVTAVFQNVPLLNWFFKPEEKIDLDRILKEATRFSERVSYHEKFIEKAKNIALEYQKVIDAQKKIIQNLNNGKDQLEGSLTTRVPMQIAGHNSLVDGENKRLEKIKAVIAKVDLKALQHSLNCFKKIAQHGRPLTTTQRVRYSTVGTTPIIEEK